MEKSKKKYKCKNIGCTKEYSSASARAVHARKCSLPSKVLSPMKKAKKAGDHSFKCRYCSKTHHQKSNVYRHQEMCNAARILNGKLPKLKKSRSKFKVYICETCSSSFDRIGKLNMRLKHSRPDHICSLCYRHFRRIDHFEKHQASCTGYQPQNTK